MSLGQRTQQQAAKNRPFWVYVWQGDLSGGGAFGAKGGWVRYDAGVPGRRVDLSRTSSVLRCIRNCNPSGGSGFGEGPVYEYRSENIKNPIPNNDGRAPSVMAFVPAGAPGETGAITSFFPPIKVEVDCQQSPLRIEGGQIPTLYDCTIQATGYIRDFGTDNIIVPFTVETTLRGPGPIIGYTVSQYTFGANQKDLRANVYYTDENNQIGDFRKNFRLSLSSLLGAGQNMTLEGDQYYFDVDEVLLTNLVRADGIDDQCGTSACTITFEAVIYTQGNENLYTETITSTLQFIVDRLEIKPAIETGNAVYAVDESGTREEIVFQAFKSDGGSIEGEAVIEVRFIDRICTYSVNAQLPGCFIETPETCNVRISDRSGILLDQTYFGRPVIETSSEYINI